MIVYGEDTFPIRLCAIFTLLETGEPLAEVPAFAHAAVSVQGKNDGAENQSLDVPLGTLASDHAGYVSYDLQPLERKLQDFAERADVTIGEASITVDHLWLHPYAPIPQSVDALAVQNVVDDAIVVRLAVTRESVFAGAGLGFASIQTPSLTDWYLSPASFSHLPVEIVGQDGCETLLPSNVATQAFQFAQVVPTNILLAGSGPGTPGGEGARGKIATSPKQARAAIARKQEAAAAGGQAASDVGVASGRASDIASFVAQLSPQFGAALPAQFQPRIGIAVAYDVTWTPVGHALGQVLYSLPLAPGEQVDIAIIDWSRTTTATRTEDTGLSDELVHATTRDRNVAEVVESTLHEWQRGGSLMQGTAVTGGFGGFVGGAASMGGTYTTSSGDRDLSANSVQNIIDGFSQRSTSIRDLRSTVVVQTTQEGSQNLQTRTIRNHNHAHAMTLLYYEVLRHYRVVVERGEIRPALLLPQEMADFDETVVFTYRRFLEAALLIPALQPGFDALEKLFAAEWDPPVPPPPDPDDLAFVLFRTIWHVGGLTGPADIRCEIRDRTLGNAKQLTTVDGNAVLGAASQFDRDGPFETELEAVPVGGTLAWRDIGYFVFTVDPQQDSKGQTHLTVSMIEIRGVDVNGAEHPLGTWPGPEKNYTSKETFPSVAAIRPAPPPPAPTPFDQLTPDEKHLRTRLLAHLNANKAYYYRQIWLGEDPNARAIRLEAVTVEVGGATRNLLDIVENRVMDVVGGALVFPLDPTLVDIPGQTTNKERAAIRLPLIAHARLERLISLPTRGVFGEAKLGHCNAAEVIDNTRFWDWQTSPIPEDAPAITGISPVAPGETPALTPTTLPASSLAIQQPPAEPDPIGLRAALDVLKTPGIFNNMSGIDQLKDLLVALTDAAVKAQGMGLQAAGKSSPGTGAGSPPAASATSPAISPTSPTGAPASTTPEPGSTQTPSTPSVTAPADGSQDTGGGTVTGPPAPAPAKPLPSKPKDLGPKSKTFYFHFANDDARPTDGVFTITAQHIANPPDPPIILAGPNAPTAASQLVGTGAVEGQANIRIQGEQIFGGLGVQIDPGGPGRPATFSNVPLPLLGDKTFTLPPSQDAYSFTVVKETRKVTKTITRSSETALNQTLAAQVGVSVESIISAQLTGTSSTTSTTTSSAQEDWEFVYATGKLLISLD